MKNLGLFRKISGYRSGSWWKSLFASGFYFFILLILLVSLFPGSPSLALEKIEPSNKSSVTIAGKTLNNQEVYLFKEDQEVQSVEADSKGLFYFPLNSLSEGNYSYTVKVCGSGKQDQCTSENILIVIDQTPPNKPLIALPSELPDDSETKITITGVTDPNTKVITQIDNDQMEAISDNNGDFIVEASLAVGGNNIEIKTVDRAGNESEAVTSTLNFDPKTYLAIIQRVVDGDTVKLESGEVVRYIGIDTPETVHPSKPVQCYGKEASNKNRELVEDKEVRLEKDVSETDKYGRLLRYVWLGDILINELLVREGYAQSSSYPPDVKYQSRFVEAQRLARGENKGLWGEVCNKTETVNTTQQTTKTTNTYVAPIIQTQPIQSTQPTTTTTTTTTGSYGCNCSKTCSQMSSCDEAQYQLNVCGCKARDGDKDGIACDADCQ